MWYFPGGNTFKHPKKNRRKKQNKNSRVKRSMQDACAVFRSNCGKSSVHPHSISRGRGTKDIFTTHTQHPSSSIGHPFLRPSFLAPTSLFLVPPSLPSPLISFFPSYLSFSLHCFLPTSSLSLAPLHFFFQSSRQLFIDNVLRFNSSWFSN